MQKTIRTVGTREIDNYPAIDLRAASYQGSAPFSGLFSIGDCDFSVYRNPETGKLMVSALCHFGSSNDEDDTIELEILEPFSTVLVEGYSGEVVDRIEWVA
jgi:hypothetical protein